MKFNLLAFTAAIASGVAQEIIPVRVGMSANGTAGQFFSPERVTAPVGSIVQFQFMGGNHTATQSAFDGPCIPVSTFNQSVVGFYSGFVPAANSMAQGNVPIFNVLVNATNPLWVYCSQGRHCQNGMVMVINENTAANSSRSLENYKLSAASVQQAGVPTIGGGGLIGGQPGIPTDPNNPQQTGQPGQNAGAALHVPIALIGAILGATLLI
jgi:plastocyanin